MKLNLGTFGRIQISKTLRRRKGHVYHILKEAHELSEKVQPRPLGAVVRRPRCRLTALFDGFVAPVGTISELVANFAQLDALAAAALELVGPVARRRCTNKELERFHFSCHPGGKGAN